MKVKRYIFLAVVAVALVSAALPVLGLRVGAVSRAPEPRLKAATPAVELAQPVASQAAEPQLENGQYFAPVSGEVVEVRGDSRELARRLGFGGVDAITSMKLHKQMERRFREQVAPKLEAITPQSNEPAILAANGAFSAAIATTIGGRDTQFDDVELLADWDGREDFTADRQGTIDDFSQKIPPPGGDWTLTRVAISAHTRANGYNENVFYYGDSFGNLYVAQSATLNPGAGGLTGAAGNIFSINLPTALNAFGSLTSDDQITITGIAVEPVADLTSFANVNSAFSSYAGLTGEIVYVSFWDTGSGFRLATNNILVRSGILAFAVADVVSLPATPPAIQSPVGFPVQVGGAFGVSFSVFGNVAGVCVDDDGSLYYQQVDMIQFTGANITKVRDVGANYDRSLAVSGILTTTTLNPTGGVYGTTQGPTTQVNRFTNYSGTSTTFGNIVALSCGPCNTVYAAVSRSVGSGDDNNSGLFPAPAALSATGTPSMIISFADCSGAFDTCTTPAGGFAGTLPVGNDIADVAQAGLSLAAGVNNFRVFALGTGPDIRSATGTSAAVGATPANTLKIDMQFDPGAHNGIAVDEEGTVYAISGGSPATIGRSVTIGEVVVFPDACPADRRGDFIDLRGNAFPNPPLPGGAVGDGDSDRFDHIFWQAPLDQVTATPTGLAGLARGFLRYLNRTAPIAVANLPNGAVQGDDTTNGPIVFEAFDPSHQVAGGDDQNPLFTGDDANGAGNPPTPGPLSGGFEFVFGATGVISSGQLVSCTNVVWNAFFLNSNGNITFGTGDTDNTPSILEFRGGLPKLAAAWTDLNPASRAAFLNTFPVQALGFSGVNAFKIRWINVPEFEFEACGQRNTFSITLYDDGTGIDENANQPLNPANPIGNNAVPFDLQEGPNDLRWTVEPNTGVLVGCPLRPDGSGRFCFDYCRMDLIGGPGGSGPDPVLVGYSEGSQATTNPPGLCEINLGNAARAADSDPFRPCLVGEGTEPTVFELFNSGTLGGTGSGGEVTFARPDFDLRFEGNDPALCTPARQTDPNRGRVCFFGKTCPLPPQCAPQGSPGSQIVPTLPVQVAPNQPAVGSAAAATLVNAQGQKIATPTAGIINALCNVQLNVIGCGFVPNEATIICAGFGSETGVPLQRPGKTVSTAMAVVCDTDGDGGPDLAIPMTNVTPVSQNLVRGTLAVASAPSGSPFLPSLGSAFPFACCGGLANLTVATTYTAGDNNQFGNFTRSTTCVIDLGGRAPVVISATPTGPFDCAAPQNLLISGFCFVRPPGINNVTSVFAIELGNPANRVNALRFSVLSPTLIDADFNFGSVNDGKTFLIFVEGPFGRSRNLLSTDPRPAGCPTGNENGIQVIVRCSTRITCTEPRPTVASCALERTSGGGFILVVTGTNIKSGATITVGGSVPSRVKFKNGRFILKGICSRIPGPIVITNPGPPPTGCTSEILSSLPFQCNERCPSGQ